MLVNNKGIREKIMKICIKYVCKYIGEDKEQVSVSKVKTKKIVKNRFE